MQVRSVKVGDVLRLEEDILGMKRGLQGEVLEVSLEYGTVRWRPPSGAPHDYASAGVWICVNRFSKLTDKLLSDAVEKPEHYVAGGIETIDYIQAKLTPEQYRGYLLGQVMKYTSRAGKKHDELEDLRKAQWYLARLIDLGDPAECSNGVCSSEGGERPEGDGERGVLHPTPSHKGGWTLHDAADFNNK